MSYFCEKSVECEIKIFGKLMIVSHKHKFIFIKTKKTAGTSLEIALSGICGDEDIITEILPEDELIRKKLGYLGCQNIHNPKYRNHIAARRLRKFLDPEIWDTYYKFCFERNPWDKVISWYYWELKNGWPMAFDDFMDSGHFAQVGGFGGYDLYTDAQDNVIVDKVYLYEDMGGFITDIEEKLGVELPELPRAKSQFRDNKLTYKEHYSNEQINLIRLAFRREILRFGYSF